MAEDATTNRPFPSGHKFGDALKMAAIDGLIVRIAADGFAVCPALIAQQLAESIERNLGEALD